MSDRLQNFIRLNAKIVPINAKIAKVLMTNLGYLVYIYSVLNYLLNNNCLFEFKIISDSSYCYLSICLI